MYKQTTLKNGLKVVTSHMPGMESVSIGLWIGVGGRFEEKRLCGISHLIEHMLFKGTTSRTANALKEAIEGVGGTFNAFTGETLTCYLVKLPSYCAKLGLDILSDMALHPTLDPAELEKEKFVVCEEIKMYMDQPGQHVFEILAETMWPNHPLGRPVAGYIPIVKNLKRQDLVNFRERFYQPANMAIVAAGKLKKEDILSFAKDTFFMPSSRKTFSCSMYKSRPGGMKTAFFRKNTKQAHLALGFHSVKRSHRLRYAALLLHIILGGNMSSRLFDRLREEKGLCYEISSSVKYHRETGAFLIHAGVDNAKLVEAAGEIIKELKELKKNSVTRDELARAKEYTRGQLLLALEDTGSRMTWLGERIMSEGKAPSVKEIFRKIERVTAGDIDEITRMIFNEKNLNFATIGPASSSERKKAKETLRGLRR